MNTRILSILSASTAAAALLVSVSATTADAFKPKKDIALITHSSAGTGNSLLLRELARIWAKEKMLPKGIKAKARRVKGGGGKKARRYVAKKNIGNNHLLWSYTPTQMMRPIIRKSKLTHKNFTPVALIAFDPNTVVVNAKSPYHSMADLVNAAKKNPRKIKQGGGPFGSSSSIVGVQYKKQFGFKASYTPYKGGGEAVVQLLGQHVDFIVENPGEIREHIEAGTLRVLTTVSFKRIKVYPKVPTTKEAGYPIRVLISFRGIMQPPGVSKAANKYYMGLLKRTQKTKGWKRYMRRNAITPVWIPGKKMSKWVSREAKERTAYLKGLGLLMSRKKLRKMFKKGKI